MTRTIAAAAIGMVAGAFLTAGVLTNTRQHHLPDCETVTVRYLGRQR